MDGFAAFLIWTVVIGGICFTAGRYAPLEDIKTGCYAKGEMTIHSTVLKCKPFAAIIDGKRVEFVEQ